MKSSLNEREQIIKQIFDKYFHTLTLSSFNYIKDYKQAEDLVQDIFVKVWQNFDEISEIKDIKGYLFKAVKNSSLNYLKHMQVKQHFVAESEFSNSEPERSPEENTVNEETSQRIHTAVNELPENWRQAFILSKYDHLKYHEIAREMNVSVKTIEKYISKSLQFLRSELKDLIIICLLIFIFFINKL